MPDPAAEVGYSVVSTQQGRGYATEATRDLIARAFADPRVKRVVASRYRTGFLPSGSWKSWGSGRRWLRCPRARFAAMAEDAHPPEAV